MNICLNKASIKDSKKIHEMQVISFKPLLEKYSDYDTNPAAETLKKIEARFAFDNVDHYLICLCKTTIGYIRIRCFDEDICTTYMLSQMFITPDYQGEGYAQAAIKQAELLYPKAKKWILETIKQEIKLRYIYEKMGYKQTGAEKRIKDGMDLIYYEKQP